MLKKRKIASSGPTGSYEAPYRAGAIFCALNRQNTRMGAASSVSILISVCQEPEHTIYAPAELQSNPGHHQDEQLRHAADDEDHAHAHQGGADCSDQAGDAVTQDVHCNRSNVGKQGWIA